MPVTLQDVVNQIDRDEPDYDQAARLGADALPHLVKLIQGDNPGLAAKASYLAGAINAEGSAHALEIAASHSDPAVRVAAAAAASEITHVTPALANAFLDDADPGVRKWGLRTLEVKHLPGIRAKVEKIMRDDPDASLREQAGKVISHLK